MGNTWKEETFDLNFALFNSNTFSYLKSDWIQYDFRIQQEKNLDRG